jgi:hypothetical protein
MDSNHRSRSCEKGSSGRCQSETAVRWAEPLTGSGPRRQCLPGVAPHSLSLRGGTASSNPSSSSGESANPSVPPAISRLGVRVPHHRTFCTGSLMTATTIRIVFDTSWAARKDGWPEVTMTSTLACMSSFASAANRSTLPNSPPPIGRADQAGNGRAENGLSCPAAPIRRALCR